LAVVANISTEPEHCRISLSAIPAQGKPPAHPAEVLNDGPCFLEAIIDYTDANKAPNVALA
jgi:hypothetical protein